MLLDAVDPMYEVAHTSKFVAVRQRHESDAYDAAPDRSGGIWKIVLRHTRRHLLSCNMPRFFISYRRSDTQDVAGRLRESLARRFGEKAVFRDKNSIAPGEDWTKAITDALNGGAIVLALIGPSWAMTRDDAGRRQLDDPADWNRIELERAFERQSLVIPVLVNDAKVPKESELPESIKALTRKNALKLRDDDWDSDIERLLRSLGTDDPRSRRRRTIVAVAALLAMILVGWIGYWGYPDYWRHPNAPDKREADDSAGGSTYRRDIMQKLTKEQNQALSFLDRDKPKAIGLIDENLAKINQALKSFPNDLDLLVLAGYAAKNVYVSSKGILPPETRKTYLASARSSFEQALKLDPKDASAVNGMGNVLFYERRFDEAIRYHEQAISLANGKYDYAEHDLNMVRQVKSGKVPFDP
jgi:tetratricopeptide (TPR) repeat protein